MTLAPSSLPQRKVCLWMLRDLFNRGQYEQRAEAGTLQRRVTRSYPTPPSGTHPPGTMSRFYEYLDDQGVIVAKAFHHDRPNDPWKPNPKWILSNSEILTPSHNDDGGCNDCGTYRPRVEFP